MHFGSCFSKASRATSLFLVVPHRNFPAQWRYLPPDPDYKSKSHGRSEAPVVPHLLKTPKTNLELPSHQVQHQQLMDLPHIHDLLSTTPAKEIAEKMSVEELNLQIAKYAYWLRTLRRKLRRETVKATKKKTRKIAKQQVQDVEVLHEAVYWKNWVPGALAYQK